MRQLLYRTHTHTVVAVHASTQQVTKGYAFFAESRLGPPSPRQYACLGPTIPRRSLPMRSVGLCWSLELLGYHHGKNQKIKNINSFGISIKTDAGWCSTWRIIIMAVTTRCTRRGASCWLCNCHPSVRIRASGVIFVADNHEDRATTSTSTTGARILLFGLLVWRLSGSYIGHASTEPIAHCLQ
jgi:hypothetical protein